MDDLGEYTLVRPLGRGGMGEVWLGHDTLLDRPVAIKLIASRAPDAVTRDRFLIEARAIARLSHPNVVAVHRVATTADGRPYLVQELLRGQSLDRLAAPLPWREVRTIGVGVARGLAAAHRRGVLHRDIKPANVMLTDDGVVKLLDFGLAKLAALGVADAEPATPFDTDAPTQREQPVVAAHSTSDLAGILRSLARAPAIELAPPGLPAATPAADLTKDGVVMGTPRYLAPELWRGEPATARSDLYALGAVLYELLTGHPVHDERDVAALREASLGRDATAVRARVPEVDARMAALLERCLDRDPSARPASADAVVHELELLEAAAIPVPEGNPYRGLRAFEAEHRALFFGRGVDVTAIVDRLRADALVVVAGDSGVGKSSVARAGVVPAVVAGALGDGRTWTAVTMTPGRHPLATLHAALAGAPSPGEGRLVLIDQAEELVTTSDPAEAAEVSAELAAIAERASGVRVLCTVRGDLLTRVAALPALAGPVARGLHLLRPLDDDGLREAVIGPARARGVAFADDATVDALVEAARGRGGLPLLQFALAELWARRDVDGAVIPAAALGAIGGVAGALTRHADGVIAGLNVAERTAARRVLSRLVTVDGTGGQRGLDELVAPDDEVAHAALDALVRGRLVVARDAADGATYHLAHDALIVSWPTLGGWLDEDVGRRAARARLEAAAGEWVRVGHRRDTLWSRRALRDADDLDELGPRERGFVSASRRAARRRRALQIAAAVAVPALIAAVYLGVRADQRATRDRAIGARVAAADTALADARAIEAEVDAARADAFARFDRDDASAEDVWAGALARASAARAGYRRAVAELEAALLLEPRAPLRRRMAELLHEQALLAERDHDDETLDDLRRRIETYDDGTVARRWDEPTTLAVTLAPAAHATLRCYADDHGHRTLGAPLVTSDGDTLTATAPPGSCVVEAEAPGRVTVRAPVLLRRGAAVAITVALPAAATAPPGFVPIPAGRFLYGAAQDESLRHELHAEPIHEVELPAYWIARTETTMGEWIQWLRTLSIAEREVRRPRTLGSYIGALEVELDGDRATLVFQRADTTYRAVEGEPLRYVGRTRRERVAWDRLPVAGVSADDALAYAAWLDASGRVPGARPCSDREWERAARGADDRAYPHGDALDDDDSDHDATYGRVPTAYGPDEVGAHPASDSPFGVADLAGNVWEWTTGAGGSFDNRGGGWYDGALSSLIPNRELAEPTMRDPAVGVRICSSRP